MPSGQCQMPNGERSDDRMDQGQEGENVYFSPEGLVALDCVWFSREDDSEKVELEEMKMK